MKSISFKFISRLVLSLLILFNTSSLFASHSSCSRPLFRIGIETIAYPSKNPLAKTLDIEVFQSVNQMKKAGYSNDVDQLFLAYKNKDIAWKTAQAIVKKIIDKQINKGNILDYVTQDFKRIFKSHQSKIKLILKEIHSFGDLANLSARQNKGVFADRMFIKKEYNQDRIRVRVIDFVYQNTETKNKNTTPLHYITLVLSAEPPYKNWLLTDMDINNSA